jgi:hypothetical protein
MYKSFVYIVIEIPIYLKSRIGTITQKVDIGKVATIQGSLLGVTLLRMQLGVDLPVSL